MRVPRSGKPYRIEAYGYRADVAATGATLRELHYNGRPLIAGFPTNQLRPAMRGAVLVPWPNRTADGRYTFDGEVHQLVVDEPQTRTASHGLLAWEAFHLVRAGEDEVVLESMLGARPGYPWQLRVRVAFRLEPDGLHQEVVVVNESELSAPVGIGGHPYLLGGDAVDCGVDQWELTAVADRVVLSSMDRMLPERIAAVDDEPYLDFRAARLIGDTVLNHCYTDWNRTHDGIAEVIVRGSDGHGARIAWDRRCGWAQIYSADETVDGVHRAALAVEPMTCPPNALNSGTDLQSVSPGANIAAGWVISGF